MGQEEAVTTGSPRTHILSQGHSTVQDWGWTLPLVTTQLLVNLQRYQGSADSGSLYPTKLPQGLDASEGRGSRGPSKPGYLHQVAEAPLAEDTPQEAHLLPVAGVRSQLGSEQRQGLMQA